VDNDLAKDNLRNVRLHKIHTITGQLSIVAISIVTFYAILFYFMHIPLLANFSIVASVMAISSRYAWSRGNLNYARFSLILIGNGFVFVLCGSLGRQSGIYLLYFPLSCAILILYNLRQYIYIIVSMAITFLCLIILEIYDYSIFQITMPEASILNLMRGISVFAALIVSLVCVFSMQFAADKAENTLAQAQEELKRYAQKMESKNKELEQFSYIASHDLNEPLRTVTSLVDLLNERYSNELDNTAKKSLNFITGAVSRMSQLIKGLLDYGRLGQNAEIKLVDLNLIVHTVCADLASSINNASAKINVGNLPTLNVYETEIRVLFQNLVSNAIKFRNPGEIPEINILAEKQNGIWTFAVKDNGIGIDAEHKDKIFIIFQRLNDRSDYEGTGIGLAHCKKIIDLHNGNIWVDSVPGEGSTFYFTLNI